LVNVAFKSFVVIVCSRKSSKGVAPGKPQRGEINIA